MKIINHIVSIHKNMFGDEIPVYVWSYGCVAQPRSRFVFSLLVRVEKIFKIERCYNERHYRRGPMDGIEGTVKIKM